MFLPRKSRFRRYLAPVVVSFGVLTAVAWYTGWLEIAAYRMLIAKAEKSGTRLSLEDYRVGIDALPLVGVADDASGLTYHPGRNSLYSVINKPPQIFELTVDGVLKRTIPVEGVADLEGITHVRGNEFFIADEATQQLIHVEIGDDQTVVKAQGRPRVGLAFDLAKNLGFEGVSWDHTQKRLFVVKEKQPLRLFELSGLATALDGHQLDLQIREWFPRGSAALAERYARDCADQAVALDTACPLEVGRRVQAIKPIQGALDPLLLRAGGDLLDRRVAQLMEAWGQGPWIFNLGHGIMPDVPVAHVEQVLRRIGAQ